MWRWPVEGMWKEDAGLIRMLGAEFHRPIPLWESPFARSAQSIILMSGIEWNGNLCNFRLTLDGDWRTIVRFAGILF
jgi:hypothetical protein